MTNIIKSDDKVLVLLGEEVTTDGLPDFIAKVKTLVGKIDQVSVIDLNELKKCMYNYCIFTKHITHTHTHTRCSVR